MLWEHLVPVQIWIPRLGYSPLTISKTEKKEVEKMEENIQEKRWGLPEFFLWAVLTVFLCTVLIFKEIVSSSFKSVFRKKRHK